MTRKLKVEAIADLAAIVGLIQPRFKFGQVWADTKHLDSTVSTESKIGYLVSITDMDHGSVYYRYWFWPSGESSTLSHRDANDLRSDKGSSLSNNKWIYYAASEDEAREKIRLEKLTLDQNSSV